MTSDDLYDSLIQARKRNENYIVTFVDLDAYQLQHIDLCYSLDRNGHRETEPLRVNFDNCLHDSRRYRDAIRNGREGSPNVWWTSTDDSEPVGCDYSPQDVVAVFDEERQYLVYESLGDVR